MDDGRVGQLLRALRRRRRWRQADLAQRSGVSQPTISRMEAGHFDELPLRTTRAVMAALDARTTLDVHWRGGQADRLIDERHAGLGVAATLRVHRYGWDVLPEVTFRRYSDRGSIDLLGCRSDLRAICIVELKSAVHSYEETQRPARRQGQAGIGHRPGASGVGPPHRRRDPRGRGHDREPPSAEVDRAARPGWAARIRAGGHPLARRPGRRHARAAVPVAYQSRECEARFRRIIGHSAPENRRVE